MNYEKYFPKEAFINAKDFKSPKELALYLKALGEDVDRYAKYLAAKDKLIRLHHSLDWCDVCEGLHTGKWPGRFIPDAWKETHPGKCRAPSAISKN